MKLLIIGASGMAGHMITLFMQEHGYEVTTLSHSKPFNEHSVLLDLTNFSALHSFLTHNTFDVIINCAGLLIKTCESYPLQAIMLNAYLPHYLETFFSETTTKIIHLSTDCVFSGKNGPYLENSPYDGQLYYDRTKALGELNNNKDLTFRMSIIGPDPSYNGIGLLNWFIKQSHSINGYTNVLWNGVTTLELAKAIHSALNQNLTGLYHLSVQEPISKYELLCLFKEKFHRDDLTIHPIDSTPTNKTLVNTRQDFNYGLPSYAYMLDELTNWIHQHTSYYPHYL